MEDFIKSIKAFLYDRASSPLFGALVVTWLTSNYKAVLISISDADIDKKIELLNKYFDAIHCQLAFNIYSFQIAWDIPTWVARGSFYPVAATIIYIYIYPFFAERVYKFSLDSQKRLRSLKKQSDELQILDEKESREILEQVHLAEAKHTTEMAKANKEITRLKQTIQSLESATIKNPDLLYELQQVKKENENLKKTTNKSAVFGDKASFAEHINNAQESLKTLDPELNADELKQLKYFGNVDETLIDTALTQSPFPKIKAKVLCAELAAKGFIEKFETQYSDYYRLTKKGTNVLLKTDEFNKEKSGRDPITGY